MFRLNFAFSYIDFAEKIYKVKVLRARKSEIYKKNFIYNWTIRKIKS